MIEFELKIDFFDITAGTFKYTTPVRIPIVKIMFKAVVKVPPWRLEFAVEVEELLEEE